MRPCERHCAPRSPSPAVSAREACWRPEMRQAVQRVGVLRDMSPVEVVHVLTAERRRFTTAERSVVQAEARFGGLLLQHEEPAGRLASASSAGQVEADERHIGLRACRGRSDGARAAASRRRENRWRACAGHRASPLYRVDHRAGIAAQQLAANQQHELVVPPVAARSRRATRLPQVMDRRNVGQVVAGRRRVPELPEVACRADRSGTRATAARAPSRGSGRP